MELIYKTATLAKLGKGADVSAEDLHRICKVLTAILAALWILSQKTTKNRSKK